ncbi:MAG: hypothetical protein QOE93_358, partial [Actinomycetota bacterium]|nr:hypothetical protein [Actinomycetota bacterium]
TLTLDGANNPDSVFIIQTDSTLTTGSASRVRLIRGARECNVFWQVGSSATLGTFSDFTGTILALTSVSVTTGVTVHGRALATTGAVTLDDDTFILPSCASTTTTTTTSAGGGGGGTPVTTPGTGGGGTGGGGGTTVTTPGTGGVAVTMTGTGGGTTPTGTGTGGGTTTRTPGLTPAVLAGVPGVVGAPRTGATPMPAAGRPGLGLGLPVLLALLCGTAMIGQIRSRRSVAPSPAPR